MELDRRLFLLLTAAAPLYAGPPIALSPADILLLDAICDQIIPPDDTAGASQAGVVYYIDKQLAGPLKRFLPSYEAGLPQFRKACIVATGKEFTALSFSEQTEFVKKIEKTDLNGFFSTVVDHTMQGFYGSPAHGGNLNEASWKMLGINEVMGGHKH